MNTHSIKNIVIVGGGTAGWLTAGLIAAKHKANSPQGLSITLVESPNIAPIGVGEGTWPTMRNTLIQMGISETDFIRQCDATFKQGAKFVKWATGKDDDFYYHPLMLPQGFGQADLAAYWHQSQNEASFSETVCLQEAVCENNLAPKTIRQKEFDSVANYAYHLDAGKFSGFLQKHCCEKLGVKHVLADVTAIQNHDNGDIAAIETEQAGVIAGDLFIDCTGFKSLLIGEHYQVPIVDCSDFLFCDTALAVQVPYESDESEIASHTISTAQDAGWIWDIGLQHRRGVGYVYSSRHTTEEEARQRLADYVGPAIDNLTVRKIPTPAGHREKFWVNNCVAIGLSAGFLEPLEASALVLVELSAQMIADQMPANRAGMNVLAKRFNQVFDYRWQRIIEFLKLHYMLTERDDSQFWRDHRDAATIPENLQDMLLLWQHRTPADFDFDSNNEVFPAASYQYVLYGMGFKTDYQSQLHRLDQTELANMHFNKSQQLTDKALSLLPSNRELINKIHQFGFQTI